MYMWANSISKGVSRECGGGFTVTEMTLEFRMVVFLGVRAASGGPRAPFPECPLVPVPLPPHLLQAGLPHTRLPGAWCPPLKGQEAAQVPVEHGAHHKHGRVVGLWKTGCQSPSSLLPSLDPGRPGSVGLLHPLQMQCCHRRAGCLPRSPEWPLRAGTGRAMLFAGHPAACRVTSGEALSPLRPGSAFFHPTRGPGRPGGGGRADRKVPQRQRRPCAHREGTPGAGRSDTGPRPPGSHPGAGRPDTARVPWGSPPGASPASPVEKTPLGTVTRSSGTLAPAPAARQPFMGKLRSVAPLAGSLWMLRTVAAQTGEDRQTDRQSSHLTRSLGAEELGSGPGGSGPLLGVLTARREPGAQGPSWPLPQALAPPCGRLPPVCTVPPRLPGLAGSHGPGGSTSLPPMLEPSPPSTVTPKKGQGRTCLPNPPPREYSKETTWVGVTQKESAGCGVQEGCAERLGEALTNGPGDACGMWSS